MTDSQPLLSMSEPLARALEIIRANLQRDSAPLQHVLVVAPLVTRAATVPYQKRLDALIEAERI